MGQLNNVSNQFSMKQLHPATFPEKLAEFFILSFSNPQDLVLDPFMGSGTTGLVCSMHNRNFIGIENNQQYFSLAKERLKFQ